jgi:5-keto 4-deoxyuronate isomerase
MITEKMAAYTFYQKALRALRENERKKMPRKTANDLKIGDLKKSNEVNIPMRVLTQGSISTS